MAQRLKEWARSIKRDAHAIYVGKFLFIEPGALDPLDDHRNY